MAWEMHWWQKLTPWRRKKLKTKFRKHQKFTTLSGSERFEMNWARTSGTIFHPSFNSHLIGLLRLCKDTTTILSRSGKRSQRQRKVPVSRLQSWRELYSGDLKWSSLRLSQSRKTWTRNLPSGVKTNMKLTESRILSSIVWKSRFKSQSRM